MACQLMMPIGVENFEEIRNGKYYYVDKSKLIEQLLRQRGKANLFLRPRRFGKSLNMSMLKYFFEIGDNSGLFRGLYIENNKELCAEYMGKYPVIFISLKDVAGLAFEEARYSLIRQIVKEAKRFRFLKDSDKLEADEKDLYNAIIAQDGGIYTISRELLPSSLQTLSELLYKHYNKKVIILIDEYDVPLDKAFQNGYYSEMVSLIRGLFSEALKSNDCIELAVLSGCLRVSKESIFTGLNNFKVFSIDDSESDEQFGFTEDEVKQLLKDYDLDSHIKDVKEWYDGYHFGDADIFCPWDVINYVSKLCNEAGASPQSYWINSSGNSLIKRFIKKADKKTRDEIEQLLNGESIKKNIQLELTYDEIDNSIDNIWSVLFTTGYLTRDGKPINGIYKLMIPNEEIRQVYKTQIKEWFKESIQNDSNKLSSLWIGFTEGDSQVIEDTLTNILDKTISVFDPKGSEIEKEKFYHAFLTGILIGNGNWGVSSNKETGDGFADILVELDNPNKGLVIEIKSVDKVTDLDKASAKAIKQIKDKRYYKYLINEGRNDILAYGIAFYKKRCRVTVVKI